MFARFVFATALCLGCATSAYALTEKVADLVAGPGGSSPHSMLVHQGKLHWMAGGEGTVYGLWRLDPAGPVLVKDFREENGAATASRMVVFDGDFYYRGQDGRFPATGEELYRYDPDTDTFYLVADLWSTSASSNPQELTEYNGHLYFSAFVSAGSELYRTDGTTTEMYNLWPGGGGSSPFSFVEFQSDLYFGARYSVTGRYHPCRFTGSGAEFMTDIEGAGNGTVWNDTLFFTGTVDPIDFPTLYRFTGGTSFTQVLNERVHSLTPLSDGMYFGVAGSLWRYNGSATMLDPLDSIPGVGAVLDIHETTGGIVFTPSGAADVELYVYDGTSVTLLHEINEGGSSNPSARSYMGPAVIDGFYYFNADDGTGEELWRTDGIPEATPVDDTPWTEGPPAIAPSVLSSPSPNPAGGRVAFTLSAPASDRYVVHAYDVTGRRVATLFDNAVSEGTVLPLEWSVADLAPGTYFVRSIGGGEVATQRVVRMP